MPECPSCPCHFPHSTQFAVSDCTNDAPAPLNPSGSTLEPSRTKIEFDRQAQLRAPSSRSSVIRAQARDRCGEDVTSVKSVKIRKAQQMLQIAACPALGCPLSDFNGATLHVIPTDAIVAQPILSQHCAAKRGGSQHEGIRGGNDAPAGCAGQRDAQSCCCSDIAMTGSWLSSGRDGGPDKDCCALERGARIRNALASNLAANGVGCN
jgi:hypothetical protein